MLTKAWRSSGLDRLDYKDVLATRVAVVMVGNVMAVASVVAV